MSDLIGELARVAQFSYVRLEASRHVVIGKRGVGREEDDYGDRQAQAVSELTQDYTILAVEEDGATGLGAVLLQDKSDPSRKVVAFRGTEVGGKSGGNTDMGDMSANAAILTGRTPEQAKAASRLLERYREEGLISAEDRLDLTGHSLGGFIAEYVAATNPGSVNAAVTFNSPGAGAHVGKVDPSVRDKIVNVHAAEGPSPVAGFGRHVGKRIAVPGSAHGIADLRENLQATKEAAERHNAEVARSGQGTMIDLSTPEALDGFTQALQRQTLEPRMATDEFGNSIPGAHHRGWAWQNLGDPEFVQRAAAGRTWEEDFFWRKGSGESNVREKFWRDHAPEGPTPRPGSAELLGRELPVRKLPDVSGVPSLPHRPDMTAQQPRARTLEYRPDEDKQQPRPRPYMPDEDGQRFGPRAPRPAPGQGDAAKLPWWADEEPPAAKGRGRALLPALLPAQNVPPGYAGMLMPPPLSLRRERAEAGAHGNGAMATVDYLRELFAEQYRRRGR